MSICAYLCPYFCVIYNIVRGVPIEIFGANTHIQFLRRHIGWKCDSWGEGLFSPGLGLG